MQTTTESSRRRVANTRDPNKVRMISCMAYYSYRFMLRKYSEDIRIGYDGIPTQASNHLLNCRGLLNQFATDMYVKLESEKLLFNRLHQKELRADMYKNLRDALASDTNASNVGQKVILPSSFIGSPRHMFEYAQDAMAYVREFGRPDLFVTFTCNSKWEEIQKELSDGQLAHDRNDIVARVFHLKQKKLIQAVKDLQIFGSVKAWLYTIEWQKRGLPHSHNLIWLDNKIRAIQIDDVISAEIPDKNLDPELHAIVGSHMLHHCGNRCTDSKGKCSKEFPKKTISATKHGEDGYPTYRRRSLEEGGHFFENCKGQRFDNRWVVPYSPTLSRIFNSHINVEYCHSVKAIKYICKYVHKGADMAEFAVDEITAYETGRYVSSSEAFWKIFSFQIHERYPAVVHLSVHLENGQRVYYTSENAQQQAQNLPPKTTLTSFFDLCKSTAPEDQIAKTMCYPEIPKHFSWVETEKKFKRRIKSSLAIGRVYMVHPSQGECYFLRLLLHKVAGPKNFDELKQVNGEICATFRDACQKRGLLADDSHLNHTLLEAANFCMPPAIRELFVIIITLCHPSDPKFLWDTHKAAMSEDINRRFKIQNIQANDDDVHNEALILIENKCLETMGKMLKDLNLDPPNRQNEYSIPLDEPETLMDIETIHEKVQQLNEEQRFVYDEIWRRIGNDQGGLIFIDAPGGTGKTFLLNLILNECHVKGYEAIATASSGTLFESC